MTSKPSARTPDERPLTIDELAAKADIAPAEQVPEDFVEALATQRLYNQRQRQRSRL